MSYCEQAVVRGGTFLVLISAFGALQGAEPVPPNANNLEEYVALRNLRLEESFDVNDLVLKRDIGLLRLSGKVAFGAPVLDRRTLAVFTGSGQMTFEPDLSWEQRNIQVLTGEASLQEPFTAAVIWFSDETYAEISTAGSAGAVAPAAAGELERVRSRLRDRDDSPKSRLEAVLRGEDIDNFEAVVLADLLNPQRDGSFMAFLRGKKYGDLRFFLRPDGALPQMHSPEEVALVHVDFGSQDEGVFYLAHLRDEYDSGDADSLESTSTVDALSYRIETTIQKNRKIEATTNVRFEALEDGERVLAFGLLPELRVTSVRLEGAELAFIQEHKNKDGSFYVVLPEEVREGSQYELEIVYAGDEVIRSKGGGNFSVGARTSWYPSLGSFKDRATFDLTFHYPKSYVLVGVGKPVGEPEVGKQMATSRWRSETPLAVAGFNYGDYKRQVVHDEVVNYDIEGYATSKAPEALRNVSGDLPVQGQSRAQPLSAGSMSPKKMMGHAVAEAQNSMRIFTKYFGELPYGRVAVTQQPEFSFGQSWPTLVYLPVSAFLDSTQRWALLGSRTFNFSHFIQELTPHEVAHQWWGHIVGWASYHDQWLSEGLADFSACLFLQATRKKPDEYIRFIGRWRESILDKNRWGFSPNDVGPIWMGTRLSTPRTGAAYNNLVYPKGGYVIHMLRAMMLDAQRGDEPFIEMMHDFVKTHYNRNASTESFKSVVEKHMTPVMDAGGDGTMDWFFNQWVYGTEVPSYKFAYKLTPTPDGKSKLEARLTQSGVSDEFVMPVPMYMEVDARILRLGTATVKGSSESDPIEGILPMQPTRIFINAYHDVLAENVENTTL